MMSGSLLLKALITLNTLQDGVQVVGGGITRVPRYADFEESNKTIPPIHEQPVLQVSSN